MRKFLTVSPAAAVACLVFFSCSSIVKTEEVKKIKKVAVVGFEVYKQSDSSGFGMIKDITSSISDDQSGENSGNELAEKFYNVLIQEMGSGLKWEIISLDTLRANKKYKALFDLNGDVSKTRFMVGKSYKLNGVVHPAAIQLISFEERKELMDSLGVDAIICFESIAYEGSKSSMGAISYTKYRITLENFEVLNNREKDPIIKFKNKTGSTPDDGQWSVNVRGVSIKTNDEKGLLGAVSEIAKEIVSTIKDN